MNNTTLIRTIGILFCCGIAALVAIFIAYDGDKAAAAGVITGFLTLATGVLVNLKQGADTAAKVDINTELTEKTHKDVNSRVTQLIAKVEQLGKVTAALALKEGIEIGRAQAKEDAASLEGS